MAEQWTTETRQLVAESLHAQRCDCGSVSEEDLDDADTALTALADTGLLVTPQMRAVLDATNEWAVTGRAGGGFDHLAAGLRLLAALDAATTAEVDRD